MRVVTNEQIVSGTSSEIASVPVLAEPTDACPLDDFPFGATCWPSAESLVEDAADDKLFSSSDSLALFSQPVAPPRGRSRNRELPSWAEEEEEEEDESKTGSESRTESEVEVVSANHGDVILCAAEQPTAESSYEVDHQGARPSLGARAMELAARRDHPQLWAEKQDGGESHFPRR